MNLVIMNSVITWYMPAAYLGFHKEGPNFLRTLTQEYFCSNLPSIGWRIQRCRKYVGKSSLL